MAGKASEAMDGWTRWAASSAVALLAVIAAFGGGSLARWMRPGPAMTASAAPSGKLAAELERWERPDLTLLVTGQQHGYLLPCGCSRPQVGGLERRYNFFQTLSSRGWRTVAVDLGDIPQMAGPVNLPNLQGLTKYRHSMQALKLMNYAAVGLGEYEGSLPLFKALGEYALNDPSPRVVVANLADAETNFPEQTARWQMASPPGSPWKVGITSVVGPSVAGKIKDSMAKFGSSRQALEVVKSEMDKAGADYRILLYQGQFNRVAEGAQPVEAEAAARAFPEYQLIVALSEEDEPAGAPARIRHADGRETLVVRIGHKGKYVGVLGLYKGPKPESPAHKYTIVQMSEDYLTPDDQVAGNPIVKLMEAYAAELRRDGYLGRHPQVVHPFQASVPDASPTFVGSEKCKKCHASAFAVWQSSPHSHAWQTLADAKRPSLREHDPECIVCHTVGFGHKGGFVSAEKTPTLKDVGCESCHGPSSEHLKNTSDETWHKLMNPWKGQPGESAQEKAARQLKVDQFCQRCHDIDNDVTWTHKGFERKWPKVAHPTPESEKK